MKAQKAKRLGLVDRVVHLLGKRNLKDLIREIYEYFC